MPSWLVEIMVEIVAQSHAHMSLCASNIIMHDHACVCVRMHLCKCKCVCDSGVCACVHLTASNL